MTIYTTTKMTIYIGVKKMAKEKEHKIYENQEVRSYNFEIRANNDEKHGNFIEGTPIVFNQRTDVGCFDEIIAPEALSKTNLKDVRFLVNHNIDMIPLARSRNNNENSTMQMTVENDGMKIRVNLDTENNSEARNLYSAIERGDVSGMSFMFTVRGDKWDYTNEDHPTRTITDIEQVFEVSAVTFPAYEQTSISARCKQQLDSYKELLENRKKQQIEAENLEKLKIELDERNRKIALLELN